MATPTQQHWKKYAAETVGTFCLVFSGTGAIVVNDVSGGTVTHVGVALTFGLVVMAMIYAVGDVSGAHLNPAVTLGFWFSKRFPGRAVVPYWLSQILGAFLASGLLRAVFLTHAGLGATRPAGPAWQSFVLETVLTAMLMFVILAVSSGAKEKGLMAGIAVGGVIALEALLAGPICGAFDEPRPFAGSGGGVREPERPVDLSDGAAAWVGDWHGLVPAGASARLLRRVLHGGVPVKELYGAERRRTGVAALASPPRYAILYGLKMKPRGWTPLLGRDTASVERPSVALQSVIP